LSAFEEIPTQPDHVPGWAIHYMIAGVVVSIGLCTFVVWLFLSGNLIAGGRTNPVELDTIPPSTSFDAPTPVELGRRAQLMQLEEWQWADRPHDRVLEPIDLAIDRYLDQRGIR
jgi:hypothetical protein